MGPQIPENELLDRVRELAEASKSWTPSPDVEARLMRAFADHRPAGRSRGVYWPLAVAAAVSLAALTPILMLRSTSPAPVETASAVAANTTGTVLDGFVPVPGAASLPPLESGRIVRYEVPVAALPTYGVEIVPDAAQRAVEADLLVGQDGYARAIRLVFQ